MKALWVVAIQGLLAAQSSEGQVEQIARTFGVSWAQLGAQMISFSIVCAVLYKFAYQRVLAMLEERRQQIAQGLANAEKIKAELNLTEAKRQEVMAQAYAQAASYVDEARAAAARIMEEGMESASVVAKQIETRAREASVRDHDQMLLELKREIGRLVVQATETVTGKVLTTEDQRRLAEETAKQVAV
jgi:F-type H+-transporting ATPase subunit b